MSSEPIASRPIVITGFGPIDPTEKPHPTPNLSAMIMQQLYGERGVFCYKSEEIKRSEEIKILTGPDPQKTPVVTAYDYVRTGTFDTWLKSTDARLYVHLGTLSGDKKVVYFEQWACNLPKDPNTGEPAVWTVDYENHYNYRKKCIKDSPDKYLKSMFNVSELKEKVIEATSLERIGPLCFQESYAAGPLFFQESYDAGNFLCNFLYYRSLYYAKNRGNANVILIHVPEQLPSGVTMDKMVSAIQKTVCCLLDMQAQGDARYEDACHFICPNPTEYSERPRGTDRQSHSSIKGKQTLTRKQARRSSRRRQKHKPQSQQRKH